MDGARLAYALSCPRNELTLWDIARLRDVYLKFGASVIAAADQIRDTLTRCSYRLFLDPPTNQVFIVMENEAAAQLARKAEISLWEKYDDKHTIVRFVTDWATQQRDVDMLIEILEQGHNSGLACVS